MLRIPTLIAWLALVTAPVIAAPGDSARATRLDSKYLVGFWTDDGDCSHALEITRDRRFITYEGGEGVWYLEGDALTMTGEFSITVRIVPVDRDTMTVINGDGSLGRSTRCATRTAPAPETA